MTSTGVAARARRSQRLAPLAIPIVWFAGAAWSHRWMQEDGFINLRIVQQLLAGHGPVFNAGERVEAYTSPLWVLVLAALRIVTFATISLEWLAVVAGIVLAVAGFSFVVAGSVAVWTPPGRRSAAAWWLPLGVLVPVALVASWDFASAGLETGLALAWLGGSFAAVARSARQSATGEPVRWLLIAALLGLGPLVRPEFGLYSVGLGAACWFASIRTARSGSGDGEGEVRGVPSTWRLALAFLALPVAYQVFRMGFFASMVPSTALAKDASSTEWSRGWLYARNFFGPYKLAVPALVVAAFVAIERPFRRRPTQIVVAGIAVPATVNGLYVVAVGGDYMHGRFWIIPLTALLAPIAAVPLPRRVEERTPRIAALVLLAGWAVLCIALWRPPQTQGPIDDQRALVVGYLHHAPVAVGDQPQPLIAAGDAFRAAVGQDVFVDRLNLGDAQTRLLPRPKGAGTSARYDAIGIAGYVAGPKVFIVDRFGLADPIAARLPANNEIRAGHTHDLPLGWRDARGGVDPKSPQASEDAIAAEHAMSCGALGRLMRGIQGHLTIGKFLSNIVHAPANTTMELPLDPKEAERRFCGSNG
jgi:arabinofuranosyltransferase